MNPKKFLIFDAGPLISLTMNGLLDILEKLKENFEGEFIITPDVKREVIDKPLKIKKYELEGIKINNLLERGILKLSSEFIPNNRLEKETYRIMKIANTSFRTYENINLIQRGEASCLAFSSLCNARNVIVVDERTVRLLSESPENLKKIMEKKLHASIRMNQKAVNQFKNFKFIRSAELLYIAYIKNLFKLKKDKTLLDALLYSVKFAGTSISSDEINEMKQLA